MYSLNQVTLMGHLVRDPQVKTTPTHKTVATFAIAVNETFGTGEDKKETVMYIDVNIWGKGAENCAKYLKKGNPVLVEGRLRLNQWEKDGQKHSKHDVTARRVHFLGGKKGETPTDPTATEGETGEEAGDKDVPF